MRKNKLLLLLVLLTMLSTRAVAQDDASAMREQMKERLDELKALAPENVKGLNQTLKNDTVKVYTELYTNLYNASPLESYEEYEEAYGHLGYIIFRVNEYLAAYKEFTDNMAKLKTLIQNFNADTEKKQEYKTFAQNVYNAYKALSDYDMIALTDENVEAQKEYDDNEYNYVPDDVTSENIADVVDRPEEYISTYGQFNAFFSQNNKELGSIYLEVDGTGTAESPENLTYLLRNPNLENAGEQWWGTEWTSIGNSAAEQSGKPFITYQPVHLPEGYYTLVGYGMDRRGSWADVLANDEDWNEDHRTYLFSHLDTDGSDSTMVDAFKAKNMALTADITNGAGNISTCEVDGVTYYTPNSMAQYRAWEDAKIAMTGNGHGAVVQFWVWQEEGDFGTLGFAHRWHADNTWFVADGIQLYYAKDNFPDINIDTPIAGETTYAVTFAEGTDPNEWTASPNTDVKKGQTVTVTYTGTKKVIGVKAEKKAAATYTLLSAATTEDIGKVVCAAGHLHDAKTAVPDGCTAVGIVGKVTSTGHGLILALKDATSQNWNTINGWTSASYAGTTLKVLPDDAARGTNLTSYTTLGETAVSNWAVGQKSDYEAIFTNLGSTVSDSYGTTYDDNVNAYITDAGGTAITGGYWSTSYDGGNYSWIFSSVYWDSYNMSNSRSVRPVLGF